MNEPKLRILFVDDEQRVLDGLIRMLRSMRNEWEVSTAISGFAALEHLAASPADVVVSDMRMPGMDGATLLSEIRALYPQTIRFILSGQSDQESVMRSVGPAHRFLSKPCDSNSLRSTIVRSLALRDMVTDTQVIKLVTRLGTLPTPSETYLAIMEELKRPNSSLQRVGEILELDVGLTAKVLQMVNSAYFGLSRTLLSSVEAVTVLGTETLRALMLVLDLSVAEGNSTNHAMCQRLRTHALHVATLARAIAKAEKQSPAICEAAFSAGLLHDCGGLLLSTHMSGHYQKVIESIKIHKVAIEAAEKAVFGATHGQVGAHLLALWGLPDSLIEVVAYHHHPSLAMTSEFSALTAVHAAEALVNEELSMRIEYQGEDRAYFEALGIPEGVSRWQSLLSVEHGQPI
jgi:HD-like signal output (HDOD) protein